MSTCDNCGGTLARSFSVVTVCEYCGAKHEPMPRHVAVPVPVNIVHNVVQVASVAGETKELRCPHCRKRLVTVVAKEVSLSGCTGCGGIWVDNGSARRVLADPDAIFGELAARAARNARDRTTRAKRAECPVCPALLDRRVTHGLELDVCGEHGTWFDANELVQLVQILNKPAKRAAPDPNRVIRCSECAATLVANEANLSDRGLLCDGCWRRRQAELVDEGETKAILEGPEKIAGALLGVASAMLQSARRNIER